MRQRFHFRISQWVVISFILLTGIIVWGLLLSGIMAAGQDENNFLPFIIAAQATSSDTPAATATSTPTSTPMLTPSATLTGTVPTATSTLLPTITPTGSQPFLTLMPDCGFPPQVTFNVLGGNWLPNEDIYLFWYDPDVGDIFIQLIAAPHSGSFSVNWTRNVANNTNYLVKAASDSYPLPNKALQAAFTVPCPGNLPEDLVIGMPLLISTPPIVAYQPVQFQMTISNTGDVSVFDPFFVDLFIDPGIPVPPGTTHIPLALSDGYTIVNGLPNQTSQIITITAPLGFENSPETHLIYGMVDSTQIITETNETNNISMAVLANATPANTPTSTPIPSATPTGTIDPASTPTATPPSTFTPTPITTHTPTISPTNTPDICSVQFEAPLVAGANYAFVSGEVDVMVAIIDLTNGANLGSDILGAAPGHICDGFADFSPPNQLDPPLIAGHVILAQGDDGTFDTAVVVSGSPTSTPISTPVSTPTPSTTPSAVDLIVVGPPYLITAPPIGVYQPVDFQITLTNTGQTDFNELFFVDLFFNPTAVTSTSIPIADNNGYAGFTYFAANSSQTITVTSYIGFTDIISGPQSVYGMVDSLQTVTESQEDNNITDELLVAVTWPPPLPPLPTPGITPSPTPSTPKEQMAISGIVRRWAGSWQPQFRAYVILIDQNSQSPVQTAETDINGYYEFSDVSGSGSYTVKACLRLDGVDYIGLRTGIVPPDPLINVYMLEGNCS